MKLSDLALLKEETLIRDSEVQAFGLLGDGRQGITIYIEDVAYVKKIEDKTNISAVITKPDIAKCLFELNGKFGIISSENPKKTFYTLHNAYAYAQSSHIKTLIGEGTHIAESACVAEQDVCIGKNCLISDGVVINAGVHIGDNCFIGENSVLGTRGFQYYRDDEEVFYIEHVGGIEIGNRVEIFSSSCIASGLFVPTQIGNDVKIDNHVHISHSDVIDEYTLIAAGVNIAGSVHIGRKCWIGIGACVSQSVRIGDDAQVNAGAVVVSNVKKNAVVSGNFAVDHNIHLYDMKRMMTEKNR